MDSSRPIDLEQAVAAAAIVQTGHTCTSCSAGRQCDTALMASAVLRLDEHVDRLTAASATDVNVTRAREDGRIEAVAQALAVLGRAEGHHRAAANGDTSHVEFVRAETLRAVALEIRDEVRDPTARTALEVMSRAEEARELSEYVFDVATKYRESKVAATEALHSVAGDIAKGTEGVSRLLRAADNATPADELDALSRDSDEDVRWWVALNPATSVGTLVGALALERHSQVLVALLQNPQVSDEHVQQFLDHKSHEVAQAARRRLFGPRAARLDSDD